jgi:phosphoribosylformylglycinamidine synthase subunit PurS
MAARAQGLFRPFGGSCKESFRVDLAPGDFADKKSCYSGRAGVVMGRHYPILRTRKNGSPPVKAKVHVTLKKGVLDPQGKAVGNALASLGFNGVNDVRQGKYIELDLDETDPAKAREAVDAMCRQLLANTVIENYAIDITE